MISTTDATTRDKLALERTKLANERTFLAYVRTSLSLIAGGAVLFQFFSAVHVYLAAAWLLFIAGGLVLFVGIWRFYKVRGELRRTGSQV
jgi:putative membrane protein